LGLNGRIYPFGQGFRRRSADSDGFVVQISGLRGILRADVGLSGIPSCRSGAQNAESGRFGPVICTRDLLKARYLHEGSLTEGFEQ
jgi:hypothetical protein